MREPGGQGWRTAMRQALYGADGFYLRPAGPAASFRTSAHDNDVFAGAVTALLVAVDAALGHPDPIDLVDLGCGHGELLVGVLDACPPRLAGRVRATGVEVAARPAGLPVQIGWRREIPRCRGLLIANEWLDVQPVELVQSIAEILRRITTLADGTESAGAPAGAADVEWVRRWWPLADGGRAEVGLDRDLAWAGAVARLERGLAVCIDYGHDKAHRPPHGTLRGYAGGRLVAPVANGTMDLTADVAMDAVRAAIPGASLLMSQRTALERLVERPVGGSLRALERASRHRVLVDPAGLGAHQWLVHPKGMDLPADFGALPERPGKAAGDSVGSARMHHPTPSDLESP